MLAYCYICLADYNRKNLGLTSSIKEIILLSNTIYPDLPRVAVGAVVLNEGKVLLVLRGKPPGEGMWAIPGGSVNLGETLQMAVEREVLEETGLRVEAGKVIYTFDAIVRDPNGRVQYHYVILDLEAKLLSPELSPVPADDVRDARWFTWEDMNQPGLPISDTTRSLLQTLMVA